MKKKFKIETLGCRTNQYESQAYSDQLKQLGFSEAKEKESADLCIVNTCTVTHGADRSSRHAILSLIRNNRGARIIVTGCMVESDRKSIQNMDSNIEIIPNREKEKLIGLLFPDLEAFPEFQICQFEAHTRAFVKVQDGCNSFCTYCIIPYVRGRSRSRKISEILLEVQQLIQSGYKEIVLTGINIGDFSDGEKRLSDLVREVDQLKGLERLRISSIDPDEVDDDLVDAILNGKKTCPSMHIVLQSGSNVILKKMNRKYTRQIFQETIEKLKKLNPDFTFTTDVIVGFPGETERDFVETLDVIEKVQFAKVHLFPYSARTRTRAAQYPNQVPSEIIHERKQRLLRASEKAAFNLREKYVGRTMRVLLEKKQNGYTENFLRVFLSEKNFRPNEIVNLYIKSNQPEALIGNALSN